MGIVHPLAAWLETNPVTRIEFARRIEISESFLSQILSKARRPSLDVAVRIEIATAGAVPASALLIKEAAA